MINTDHLSRCIQTLEEAYGGLGQLDSGEHIYDIYRAACVKEFEIIVEQSAKLLKKALRPHFASNQMADRLTFKDVFRHAMQKSLIDTACCERWFAYRDNRNHSAHDYGVKFAESTLELLEQFIIDANFLLEVIQKSQND